LGKIGQSHKTCSRLRQSTRNQIWRGLWYDQEFKRVISSEKELVGIVVDPKSETADIDSSNNSWPKKEQRSEFEQFKQDIKGK